MAITGDGFFSIQKATGIVDNVPVFSGVTYYTRRGDFQLNANGNLVNGAGYYLMGVTVDSEDRQPHRQRADGAEIPEQLHPGASDDVDPVRGEPADPAEHPGEHDGDEPARCCAAGGLNPSDFAANPLPVGTPPAPYANATVSGAAATGNIRSPYSSTTGTSTVALQNNSSAAASTTTLSR